MVRGAFLLALVPLVVGPAYAANQADITDAKSCAARLADVQATYKGKPAMGAKARTMLEQHLADAEKACAAGDYAAATHNVDLARGLMAKE